jgi:hypothetical protein
VYHSFSAIVNELSGGKIGGGKEHKEKSRRPPKIKQKPGFFPLQPVKIMV